ncbi:MAG: hypothetical protein Q8O72_04620 [Bacteroidales bacterium]|nr:hypothetical protein [Bacteroidales bacterium]
MKIILVAAFLLLTSGFVTAQKVFSVEYANQADVKVFVVEYENQAGWKSNKKKDLMY